MNAQEDLPRRQPVIVANIAGTHYDIVKRVFKEVCGWTLTDNETDDFDVCWTDLGILPERLACMKTYQKISHFPGMFSIARKNYLGRYLKGMHKQFPEDFGFFPQTWVLPADLNELKLHFSASKIRTYIVKPEASCQGRGIFLTRKIEDIPAKCVVQRYLAKPYLMEGLKFDLRVYVLVTGCDPLRIFLHEEGLARFATEPYQSPLPSNFNELCMHLTNYAINKSNPKFIFNETLDEPDVGHKRSITALLSALEEQGVDVEELWEQIEAIVVKTLLSVQPVLAHFYNSSQPDDPSNSMCFEVLGFDIFIDAKLKPWLLEVNHAPSFSTDTPLDFDIKKTVLSDAFALLDVSRKSKLRHLSYARKMMSLRAKSLKYSDIKRHKANIKRRWQLERDQLEAQSDGAFTKVYPADENPSYSKFLEGARIVFAEQTLGRGALKYVERHEENKAQVLKPIKQKRPVLKPQTSMLIKKPAVEMPCLKPFFPTRVLSSKVIPVVSVKLPEMRPRVLSSSKFQGSYLRPKIAELSGDSFTETDYQINRLGVRQRNREKSATNTVNSSSYV
jgi:tubulin polyglutamylase TTLL6/13